MTKLCARGKSAAKRKFRVYPSAYANAYASKICAGKAKDPSGLKRKDFKGPKPTGKKIGGEAKVKINEVIGGLKKASKTHAGQAKTLETLKANKGSLMEKDLVDVSYFGDKAMKKYKKYKNSKETQLHSKTKKDAQQKAKDRALNEMLQEEKVKPNFSHGGEVRGGGAAIRGLGFKGVF